MGGQTFGKSHCCWCWGVELKREAGIPPGWLSNPDASSWSRNLLKVHSVYISWMVKEPAQGTLSVHKLNGQGTCSKYTQCTSAEWSSNQLKVHSVYIRWMVKEPAQSTLSVHQLHGQYQRGPMYSFSVVFTPPSPSHHGSVFGSYLSSLYS